MIQVVQGCLSQHLNPLKSQYGQTGQTYVPAISNLKLHYEIEDHRTRYLGLCMNFCATVKIF